MTLEGFEKYRRCDYFDEARCVKRILQEYLFSRNPKTYEKCLPPCKGTTFIADTVTVCVQFVVEKLLYKVSTSSKRFVSIGMQMPVPMPSSKNSTIFLMIWQYFLSKLSWKHTKWRSAKKMLHTQWVSLKHAFVCEELLLYVPLKSVESSTHFL